MGKTKIMQKQMEMTKQREKFTQLDSRLKSLIGEIYECMDFIQRPEELKKRVTMICENSQDKIFDTNKHARNEDQKDEEIMLNKILQNLQIKQKENLSDQRKEKKLLLEQNQRLLQEISMARDANKKSKKVLEKIIQV